MLFTRSIFDTPVYEDGLRISVMSRHTLNDGITPDERIQKFHFHIPSLGPSPRLIGSYYKRGMSFDEFSILYLHQISSGRRRFWVHVIAFVATFCDITLLCVEDDAQVCHRSILARECVKYQPNLTVTHR
jgi:uncharacterized protein YeaO (DUF488 family)